MGNYEQLKAAVSAVIKTNGNQEITGAVMQSALLSIISTVGDNATFAGIATPDTNPGTPDQNVFYIAAQPGVYSNFGGSELTDQVLIFTNKNGSWVKTDSGIATISKVVDLESKTNRNVYTHNILANSIIKYLYIDIENYDGSYILDGLKIGVISRGKNNLWGFTVRNINEELIFDTWKTQEVEYANIVQNGIKAYVVYDWSVMETGNNYSPNSLLLPLAFNSGNSPFVGEERIIDNSISSSKLKNNSVNSDKIAYGSVGLDKLDSNSSASLNNTTFTKEYKYNAVIRKLFIDVSEYTGSISLDGLKIGILAKNVSGKWGIQLRNSQNETIISAWMNSQQSVQSVTVDGIYMYAEYNWENKEEGGSNPFEITNEVYNKANDPRGSVTSEKIASDVNLSATTLTNGLYGQAGDSISEGAGLDELLPESDIYAPISGTKKATYGYYIAKLNRMRWANYGISGSTLGFVVANGQDKNGFSKENGRYTQMDNDLTHLSIFFGWNDDYYGNIMKREEWLFSTYSTKIYYPRTPDLIGTNAPDGTPYTTQDQYDAVNAVTGEVGGKSYDNNVEYFNALYVGTESDSTNKTFWGAWNIVLPYLIEKYPLAKILIIVPYGTNAILRQCVRDAAKKYGLPTYDFSSIVNQLFFQWDDNRPNGMIGGKTVSKFRIEKLTKGGTHPNSDGYKYLYPSINAKLLSL